VASFAHRAEDVVGVALNVWTVGQDVQARDVRMADLNGQKTICYKDEEKQTEVPYLPILMNTKRFQWSFKAKM